MTHLPALLLIFTTFTACFCDFFEEWRENHPNPCDQAASDEMIIDNCFQVINFYSKTRFPAYQEMSLMRKLPLALDSTKSWNERINNIVAVLKDEDRLQSPFPSYLKETATNIFYNFLNVANPFYCHCNEIDDQMFARKIFSLAFDQDHMTMSELDQRNIIRRILKDCKGSRKRSFNFLA